MKLMDLREKYLEKMGKRTTKYDSRFELIDLSDADIKTALVLLDNAISDVRFLIPPEGGLAYHSFEKRYFYESVNDALRFLRVICKRKKKLRFKRK
jgi:hypothetical protein